MDQKTFDDFFEPYSKNVDNVDVVSAFWRLSDSLIMRIIKDNIGANCNDDSIICDAGGGTGRWAINMSKEFPGKFLVYDRSKDMLAKARENISKADLENKISLTQGDLTSMTNIQTGSIDHMVSIYSPISFIYEAPKAAAEIYRVLKPGGKVLIMGHGYFNALNSKINNYRADNQELKKLATDYRVKWAPYVPELVTYSKESMEELLGTAGFKIEKSYGVPVLVQPGPEDFDPENSTVSAISKYLENPETFQQIFNLEMTYNSQATVTNRGMNIFTLATKS